MVCRACPEARASRLDDIFGARQKIAEDEMISRVSEEAVKLIVEEVKAGASSDRSASGPNNRAH